MKRLLKNAMLMFFTLALLCAMCPVAPSAASTRKCYTIASGNTPVYGNTGLTRKIGTIYGSDQITVNTVKSAYTHVTYPISGGRTKSGYIRTSAILLGTGGNSYKARAKMTTYKRPGGASYGYVSSGDTVTVLGASGSYTQVKYPVSGGYKYGFITTANANNYVYGSSGGGVSYSSVANGTYVLYSGVANNKVLDVNGNSSADGTNIHLWESNGTAAQKFNITKQSNGWYKIANVNGKALDVDKAERKNGANVIQWGWSGTENQQWKFVSAGGGYYYIQSRLGYYLDVSGAGTANGTNIQMWEKNNTNAQKWKLVSASNSSGGGKTYYVTTQAGLRLRKSASTLSATLTTMPYGASVTVYSISNGWANLSYNGKKGYASATYLSTSKPAAGNTKLSYGLYKNSSARISCGFDGYTTTAGRHEGIDFVCYNGAAVYSLTDGEVVRVAYGKNGSSGLSTIAIYDNSANKTVVYLHTNPVVLKAGQRISKGQKIGTQGWRGVSSVSGSHTHVEVRNGRQGYAAKSVKDYNLENPNPSGYWSSKGYVVQ